jgi:hypothetical protein
MRTIREPPFYAALTFGWIVGLRAARLAAEAQVEEER